MSIRVRLSAASLRFSNTHADADEQIANLEKVVQDLRIQLADSQGTAKQTEDSLNETIGSLRADLCIQSTNSSTFILTLT